jgi:neutral ceramidase
LFLIKKAVTLNFNTVQKNSMLKFLRFILKFVLFLILLLVVFLAFNLTSVDRTSYHEQDYYAEMMARLDSLDKALATPTYGRYRVGFDVENITPSFPVATAGYGNRRGKNYSAIHDSVYVRTIVIDNGKSKVAIVSADLLIIPPEVTETLEKRLYGTDFSLQNVYLNATHTHNSIGNWTEGAAEFLYGTYNKDVVEFIATRIVASIQNASAAKVPSDFSYGHIDVPTAVRHRIDGTNGVVDPAMRVIEITREDSSRMAIVSYNAHATCLFSRDLDLSRDYPGELVDDLEERGYAFAMFLSGAVGSHGCNPPEYGKPCIEWMSNELTAAFDKVQPQLKLSKDSALLMVRIPLALGEPQVRVSEELRLRPWLFRKAFGEYQPFLTALRIGEITFLGTPCDFAGDLRTSITGVADPKSGETIITSFNGHYIGYITKDVYYDHDHYETRLMNWYGPGNGAYISDCMSKLHQIVTR